VKLLVARGADVNAKDFREKGPLVAVYHVWGTEPARFMTKTGAERAIIMFLLQHGADPNETYVNGDAVIHRAAHSGDHELLDEILRRGGVPGLAGGRAARALQIAADRADEAMVSRLIDAGADVNDRDNDGGNVLHRVIERLCYVKASKSQRQRAPALRLLRQFVERRADQTALYHGATPALLAVRFELPDALAELTHIDEAAVRLAEREQHGEILEIMMRRGTR
jgi:hypothetical protein